MPDLRRPDAPNDDFLRALEDRVEDSAIIRVPAERLAFGWDRDSRDPFQDGTGLREIDHVELGVVMPGQIQVAARPKCAARSTVTAAAEARDEIRREGPAGGA